MKKILKNKSLLIILYVVSIIILVSTFYLSIRYNQNVIVIKLIPLIKIICYGCVFLPIPAFFLRDKTYFFKSWFVLITIWSFFISYTWLQATIFIIILFVFPIYTIINKGNKESKKNFPNHSYIFFPLAVTSFIVSFITRELIWVYGAATMCAWGLVSILQQSTIGNIYSLIATYSNTNSDSSRKWRAALIYIFLLLSFFIFIFLEGKELNISFWFSSINSKIIEVSLTVIAILIALQSFINRSYSGITQKEKIFEAKLNIETMKAIRGVMALFLLLICFSIIAYISRNIYSDVKFSLKLWLSPLNIFPDYFNKSLTIFYFSLILSTCILSLYQIYFVFISGELVLLPHKIFVKRSMAVIEESSIYGIENIDKLDSIKNSVRNHEPLNGQIIKDLNCVALDIAKPHELFVTCKIEVLIPEKTDLLDIALNIALCIMKDEEIVKVNVWATAMVYNLGTHKIFSAEIDLEKLKLLREKPIYQLSFDEKIEIVKPFFQEYPFKEAYLF